MMSPGFLAEHRRLTRRFFVRAGTAGLAAFHCATRTGRAQESQASAATPRPAAQPKAGARADPYFTPQADFRGVSRGKPLREIVWLTQPQEKLRRVFYYGYHNDDPAQMFRSSLPIGRVLEDPFDLPPVIVCYRLNGQWLESERGGPVRMVVPEAYGFKSVKWLSHVVLTNLAHANDTYAEADNDIDSPIKTFAATLDVAGEVPAGQPIAVSGYAQVGWGGCSRVQAWLQRPGDELAVDDPYHARAPWRDAELLPAPRHWGDLPDGKVPPGTHGFDDEGRPTSWPLRFTKVHWAALLPALPAGKYTLRCRSVDEKGIAQPMPRPLRKGGHAAIQAVDFQVTD